MDAIRRCLRTAAAAFESGGDGDDDVSLVESMSVPPIIHSTFLRYYSEPSTFGSKVQERFRDTVIPRLASFFPYPISVPVVKFVVERSPYMHIPHDPDHVVLTSFLTSETGSSKETAENPRFVTNCRVAEQLLEDLHSK